jgi:hypothetical protein
MDWKNAINDIIQKYSGQGGGTAAAPASPHEDFQRVAQAAPKDVVASGLSEAFRSEKTPAFPQMLASMFGQSNPNQQAGLLNKLLTALGPEAASMIPGVSSPNVTPQQASQITPDQVQQMAERAQSKNPSIVDQVSSFYAQHPDVVKAVGGMALSIMLQHIVRRRG